MDGGARAKKVELGNGVENVDPIGMAMMQKMPKRYAFQTDFGVFERFNYAPNPPHAIERLEGSHNPS